MVLTKNYQFLKLEKKIFAYFCENKFNISEEIFRTYYHIRVCDMPVHTARIWSYYDQ